MVKVLYDPGAAHTCDLPSTRGALVNTIIQCENCEKTYELLLDNNDEPFWFHLSNVVATRKIQRLKGEIPPPGKEKRRAVEAFDDEAATPVTKGKKK